MPDIAAACLVATAWLAYVNHRFVRMPRQPRADPARAPSWDARADRRGGPGDLGGACGQRAVVLSLPYCLPFGALISPTDPMAVMGMFKLAGVPKERPWRWRGPR